MITALILETKKKNKLGPTFKNSDWKNMKTGKNNSDIGIRSTIKFIIVRRKTSRNVNGLASIIVFTLHDFNYDD